MPLPTQRLIAHLDMDAFYASVELLRYPELRGQAGGHRRRPPPPAGRGDRRRDRACRPAPSRRCATTSGAASPPRRPTRRARSACTRRSGLMKAAQLAPDAMLLPTDFDAYRKYSRLFKAAVATIAPQIEDHGIDEIYIDLTDVRPPDDDTMTSRRRGRASGTTSATSPRAMPDDDPWWRVRDVAKAIKEAVHAATGLTCSIGVAPNKLLAKIASELDKPDGLTIVRPEDIATRIWPLPRAQDQRHRTEVEREARSARHPHDRRAGCRRAAMADRAFRPALRRLAARCRARARRRVRW